MGLRERIEKLARYGYYGGHESSTILPEGEYVCLDDVLASLDEEPKPHVGTHIGDLKYIRMQLRGMALNNANAEVHVDRAAEMIDNALEELER